MMTTMRTTVFVALMMALAQTTMAFAPSGLTRPMALTTKTTTMSMMDPSSLMTATTTATTMMDVSSMSETAQQFMADIGTGTNPLLAFADQGQNLAGIFFQASLLPYLAFLYFLSFRGNRIPALGNFGFQFVLLFVIATIPSGIISKATYGCSLADVDWLHGGAEALLTVANIMLVLGFKEATKDESEQTDVGLARVAALGACGLFAAACALGPGLGVEAHSPFLLGAGNLDPDFALSLPFGRGFSPPPPCCDCDDDNLLL